jgi:uncharacterized protein (DUF433 family)
MILRGGDDAYNPAEVIAVSTLASTIQKTTGVNGGSACVRDTRIPVWSLIQLMKLGRTEKDLLSDFPSLSPDDLDAVWAYYRKHTSEIETEIAEQEQES